MHCSVSSHNALLSVLSPPTEEEQQEEEFLDSLPTDMLEEDDLQRMRELAGHASFITRDLSSG